MPILLFLFNPETERERERERERKREGEGGGRERETERESITYNLFILLPPDSHHSTAQIVSIVPLNWVIFFKKKLFTARQ